MKYLSFIILMMSLQSAFAQNLFPDKTEEKTSHPIKIIKHKPTYKSVDTVKLSSAKIVVYVGVNNSIQQRLPFSIKHKISYQTDIDATITNINNNEFIVYMGRQHAKTLVVYVIDGDVLKGKLYYKIENLPEATPEFAGLKGGKTPLAKLKNGKKLSAVFSNINFKPDVSNFSVRIVHKGKTQIFKCKGNVISAEIQSAFNLLTKGDQVYFENISIMNNGITQWLKNKISFTIN